MAIDLQPALLAIAVLTALLTIVREEQEFNRRKRTGVQIIVNHFSLSFRSISRTYFTKNKDKVKSLFTVEAV